MKLHLYYAPYWHPWEHALRFGTLALLIIGGGGLLLLTRHGLFHLVEIIAVCTLAILTACVVSIIAWSQAAAAIDRKVTIALDGTDLRISRVRYVRKAAWLRRWLCRPLVEKPEHQTFDECLSTVMCRVWDGYSFHDPLLRHFRPRSALIVAWPPYDDVHRVAFGFSSRQRRVWMAALADIGACVESPRGRYERFLLGTASIAAGLMAAIVAIGVSIVVESIVGAPRIPGPPLVEIVAFVWAAVIVRMMGKSYLGDAICHSGLMAWAQPPIGITCLLVVPTLAVGAFKQVAAPELIQAMEAFVAGGLGLALMAFTYLRLRVREVRQFE